MLNNHNKKKVNFLSKRLMPNHSIEKKERQKNLTHNCGQQSKRTDDSLKLNQKFANFALFLIPDIAVLCRSLIDTQYGAAETLLVRPDVSSIQTPCVSEV
jgi:hypothetical protein